jgi:hypothetical protein
VELRGFEPVAIAGAGRSRATPLFASHLDGKGGYLVTFAHGVIDRLKAIRGPARSTAT